MKIETAEKIRDSNVILLNVYKTDRGTYRISILQHKSGDLYFCKTKDGELCELVNLSSRGLKNRLKANSREMIEQ